MTPTQMPLVLVEKWRTATWDIKDVQNNLIAQCAEESEASQLISAVNSTYGKGIDPSSVPELLDVVEKLVEVMGGRAITFPPLRPVIEAAKAIVAKSIIKQ